MNNKDKIKEKIEQLKSKRNLKPPTKIDRIRKKIYMKKVDLEENPEIKEQYVALVSFIGKHTPQKSDYDGLKIHKVYPYRDNIKEDSEIRKDMEYFSNINNVDVHAVLVGKWIPWNPRKGMNEDDVIHKDVRLQEALDENRKARHREKEVFDADVVRRMRKGYLESKLVSKRLGEMKTYRTEEQDGPMRQEFWQPGDKELLEEIVTERKQIESDKKRLGIEEPKLDNVGKLKINEDSESDSD